MSTVIGGPVAVRVGPKVFADIPSAQELVDARRAIDNMRRARNGAMLWVILLAGALVAAGVFIFLLMGRPEPKTDPANDPAKWAVEKKGLEDALKTSQANFEAFKTANAEFSGIPEAGQKYKDLSAKIKAFVDDTATYGDIKKRTIADSPNRTATTAQWAVYEKGAPVWKGDNALQVKASLDQQGNDLDALLTQIKATGPKTPPIGPGPGPGAASCVGPNCPH